MNKYFKIALIILLAALGVMTFASNPFADFAATDSAVFYYIGSAMHRGVIPYRDVFDHKGLLIYVINWLASFCGPSLIGLWVIEIAFAALTFFQVYRFAEKQFGAEVALAVLFPYAAMFAYCNMGGNFTETYAHLLIVQVLLWTFSHAQDDSPFTKLESVLSGIFFSAIIFLRPNMGAVGFVAALFFIVKAFRTKGWMPFLKNSFLVFAGMFVGALPFVAYLHFNNAIADCIRCYISYNLSYASGNASSGTGLAFAYALMAFGLLPFVSRRWRKMALYNYLFLALTSVLLYMNAQYKHYFMMLIPGSLLPLMCVCMWSSRVKIIRPVFLVLLISFSMVFLLKECAQVNFDISGCISALRKSHDLSDIGKYKEGHCYSDLSAFRDKIKDFGSVGIVGIDCEVYRRLGVSTAGYFAYIPVDYDEEMRDAVRHYILSGGNKYLIVNNKYMEKYYETNYIPIVATKYIPISRSGNYVLWGLKEHHDVSQKPVLGLQAPQDF